jgi:hypothetical protein
MRKRTPGRLEALARDNTSRKIDAIIEWLGATSGIIKRWQVEQSGRRHRRDGQGSLIRQADPRAPVVCVTRASHQADELGPAVALTGFYEAITVDRPGRR